MTTDVPDVAAGAIPNHGTSHGPSLPRSVMYDGSCSLDTVLAKLGVPERRPVLVLAGWAGADLPKATRDSVDLLLREVVVPVCIQEGAVIVSGGTDAGVMAALGRAATDSASGPVLVGVAPDAKVLDPLAEPKEGQEVPPEPGHRLVRTLGAEWGDEGPVLVRVAERIADGRPVLVLAVGGGQGTAGEIALAARRGWPVLLMTGHRGTSDAVAAALGLRPLPETGQVDDPPAVAEPLVEQGEREARQLLDATAAGLVAAADLGAREQVRRATRWRLSDQQVLKEAWTRFAAADLAAVQRKKPTTTLAATVVGLATLTVLFALAGGIFGATAATPTGRDQLFATVAKGLVTALPLVAGLFLVLIERRARSGTWVELRAAAETLVREIYRARSRPTAAPAANGQPDLLGEVLQDVDRQTGGRLLLSSSTATVAGRTWPPPQLWGRVPACDCLLGPLTAEVYDAARVVNQLSHYERAAKDFARKATRLATMIFAAAGVAAFLLALSWRYPSLTLYAAVPASLAAALVSWREYRQRDARVDAMLTTCIAVREARSRWLSVPPACRAGAEALSTFVREVEDAFASEGTDWERGLRLAHQNLGDRYGR